MPHCSVGCVVGVGSGLCLVGLGGSGGGMRVPGGVSGGAAELILTSGLVGIGAGVSVRGWDGCLVPLLDEEVSLGSELFGVVEDEFVVGLELVGDDFSLMVVALGNSGGVRDLNGRNRCDQEGELHC